LDRGQFDKRGIFEANSAMLLENFGHGGVHRRTAGLTINLAGRF
jgi:hypothetical protein